MAFLEDLSHSLFGGQVGTEPYLQQAAQEQAQAEKERQRLAQIQAQQQSLAGYLQMLMSGGGPSVAQQQLMMGLEQGRKQQDSMSAGLGGPSAGLGQYLAAQNTGRLAADTNQQGALLRAQEQIQARGQLGQTLLGSGQLSLGSAGQAAQSGLGYSGIGANVENQNANRTMQQEGALLKGAGDMGGFLFSKPPIPGT